VKKVAISEFKAKCLAIVDQVQKTKRPILITRRGKPVAEVIPAAPSRPKDLFGFMKGSVEILGDIVSPANDPEDWEVLRD
jgi:prevent-host-death family protein